MADPEQVERLKRGVYEWNMWRQEHPDIRPDLRYADLTSAHLSYADLSRTYLSCATLINATLIRTNFSSAILTDVNLINATLIRTNFSSAILTDVNLTNTTLTKADLTRADLTRADLIRADLTEANFNQTIFRDTVFAWVDLSNIKGLETARHRGPSTININSVTLPSNEQTRLHFLRGVGFPDTLINHLPSLLTTAIQYQSCFISYSSKDDPFARKLYADLQKSGVRCWFAPHDLKWGTRIRTGIDEAIYQHERVLLILSEHALASGWVELEVKKALSRERKQRQTVLFPVRVDRAILESPLAWATEIRHERNVGNFSRWKNDTAYQEAFGRLLRDLKVAKPQTR